MIIGSKKRLSQVTADPAISVGNLEIKRVETTKSLGLMIDESLEWTLDWTAQVEHISKKVTSGLAISEFGKRNANATSTINLLGLGRVREIISTVPPKFEFGKCYGSEHGRYGKQRRNSRYIVNCAQ
jgi:hypothetical protein